MRLGHIDRYVLQAIYPPLIGTIVVAVMLLLLEQMLRLFDFVLIENGPVYVVWSMLAFLVPEYLALAVSLGLFLGVLLGFRKLSLSSELDATLAGGVSLTRLMRPVYLLSVTLMVLNFGVVAYIQPYSLYGYSQLKHDTSTGALGFSLPAGDFVSPVDGVTLRVGQIRDTKDAELREVFMERCDEDGTCTIMTAKQGTVFRSDQERVLKLRVQDGRMITRTADGTIDGILEFETQDVPVDLPRLIQFRERGESEQEATMAELFAFIGDAAAVRDENFNQFRGEFHYRLLQTLSFLTIPLMALPFGLTDQRRTSNAGPVVGVSVLIIYNEFLEAGERQVAIGEASPWFAMWPSFIVFSLVGAFLFYRVTERPGRRRIKALEWFWDHAATVLAWIRSKLPVSKPAEGIR